MIAQNEIEARMRWTQGSRRAENLGRAIPPNLSAGRGREVGPREIPAGLSAARLPQGRYPLTETPRLSGREWLSVGACLYRLFILRKSMEDTEV